MAETSLDPLTVSREQWDREWLIAPFVAAVKQLETKMAQGFAELNEAVQALAPEGGQTRDLVSTAIALLTSLNVKANTLQASANTLLAEFAAAGQGAGEKAATIRQVTSELDTEQGRLKAALDALQPIPEPAPESAPAEGGTV